MDRIKNKLVEWYPNSYIFQVEEDTKTIIHMSKEYGFITDVPFRVDKSFITTKDVFDEDGLYIELMMDNHRGVNFIAYKIYKEH